jgi:dTDP-4-amino-4,6-dideoxygalactose transaminase
MSIKFIDLAAQNREISARVEREFAAIHERAAYIGGPQVEAFETEFAAFLGVRRVIGVGSGTDALRLSLMALGINAGDEVITSPMTFIATAEAIVQAGARPVFVDIDPDTGNISVPALLRYLEEKSFRSANGPRAIVPVHLYGLPAQMIELRRIADAYGLKLVEDACQAHGARIASNRGWVRAGTIGEAGCFSFYPGKNLGAWGEAGAVATNNDELAEEVRHLRDHGRLSHYAHRSYGYNARLDALQAAVLRAKLEHLDQWNASRRRIAAHYRELLPRFGIELIKEPEGVESCYHLFVIRSRRRDAIRAALLADQIECGIHYPLPLHLQPACKDLGYLKGDFPTAEAMAASVLSLPMHPQLTDVEVRRVSQTVEAGLAEA